MKALNLIPVGDPADETFTLNLGPQHPATHGVLRVKLVMDGEYITSAQPVIGYIHRMHEKMAENRPKMPVFAQKRPIFADFREFSRFLGLCGVSGRGFMRRSKFPEQFRNGTPVRRRFSGLSAANLEKRKPGAVKPLKSHG